MDSVLQLQRLSPFLLCFYHFCRVTAKASSIVNKIKLVFFSFWSYKRKLEKGSRSCLYWRNSKCRLEVEEKQILECGNTLKCHNLNYALYIELILYHNEPYMSLFTSLGRVYNLDYAI